MQSTNTSIRLKQLMNERKLKQIDIVNLAEPYCKKYNVKLAKNDLSQYLSGKVEPGQKKLMILSKALNVSPTWLMGLDDKNIFNEFMSYNEYLATQYDLDEISQLYSKAKCSLTKDEKDTIIFMLNKAIRRGEKK